MNNSDRSLMMEAYDKVFKEYIGSSLHVEEDPMPGAVPQEVPAQPDATEPAPIQEPENLTPEGRIQMLDMVRKALLIAPADLKQNEKSDLGVAITHSNVERQKGLIDGVFNRIEATGTSDLGSEEPGEDF